MSDFKSSFDRDMYRAAELGKRAAEFEISTARVRAEAGFILDGIRAGSDRVRYEFRKGILNRYVVTPDMDEWTRDAVTNARMSLHAAYYSQPHFMGAIADAIKAEIVEIDGHAEIVIPELVSA